MLSSRDDDDDNHLCIKCNATIIGLDNYVKHRKERCGKLKTDVPKSDLPPIDPLEPSYSLGADVFFQSLELQSSVKKTNSLARLTPPIPTTKASLDRKHTLVMPSTSRDIPRMSPLETNLRGEDWIGGHSLRIGVNEDNQTKLINAVASISGTVKKDIPTSSYSITYDYKGDEDSEVSEESEDEDDDDQVVGGKWKPPLNYTGGKWRPVSPEHEEWEQENADGKWQTIMHDENDEDYDAPPPDHTKGKWVPGANDKTQIMQTTIQTKGSVQYWCGPCNRRLGSRAIYDKHLKSKLHMKNVLPEHELEFSGHLEPMKNITTKRITRPSIFLNENIYSQLKRKKSKIHAGTINVKISTKKRKRNPYFVNCPGCKSRVRQHLMGKHLISHYHFRKTTNINTSDYQQLIIDNIEAVVHQSPFQCSPCKFYTNWLSTFMQHWFSKEHELKMADTDGKLWCSFCKFNCDSSQDMLQHMSGPDHSEVVAVINRSMPIIIRKKTIIKCETCDKEFRYNIEMKRHNQETGHGLSHTATDNYQEIHKCKHCSARFKSSLSLAAHLKSKHKQRAFLCLVCEKSFSSSEESKRHRQTSEHSIKRRELLKEKGATTTELRKKCPYCPQNVILSNILMLKEHIRRMHPHIRKRCPKCGMAFIFSQEVTRHIRANACEFNSSTQTESHNFWSCSQCLFTTDSQAECFFHEVLHTMPKKVTINTKTGAKVVQKYTCPLCPRSYRKASLRVHLRQHTSERPFICSQCGANFTRQTSLVSHVKREHGPGAKVKSSKLQTIVEKIEDLECKKCKEKFKTKSVLNRHDAGCISSPGGPHRCPHDQCIFVTNNLTTLAKHRRTHGERIKHHECHLCPFKSDQASHLKRHMLCHQGIKPYACPHCSFTSGSLENLRKHVLRSGRHPGSFLYHCRLCPYNTNTAMEFRLHLTTAHAHKFNSKTAVQAAKIHLMIDVSKKVPIS